jgi:TonB-dependent receptor
LAAPHEESYWLPAATLTWNFAEDLQMRMGYSQTIARPQLRELAVSPFTDPDTGRSYRGNPLLKDSKFDNYDARLEYYFGQDQFVTAGGFYKEITDPVEEAIFVSDRIYTGFLNAPKAVLYGAELEFRTHFDMPFDALPFLDGEIWRFAANYTYTHSEVQADAGDLVTDPFNEPYSPQPASNYGLDKSPALQGTPENLANIQFGFETDASQMTLLVGWVDERILRRGNTNVPDVIENPGVNVDLTFRRDFTFGDTTVTFGASGRNLLDEDHEEYQTVAQSVGGEPVRTEFNSYARGRSFSLSLTSKF